MMRDYKTTPVRPKGDTIVFVKWILIIILTILVIDLLFKPLRNNWSNDYLTKGDIYLEQKKYLSAIVQYNKALLLSSKNKQAINHKDLAFKAQNDISVLQDFFSERKIDSEIAEFDKATAEFDTPAQAAQTSKELIQLGEYQLAVLPAQKATETNPEYKDGWIYLGIARYSVIKGSEISNETKKIEADEAKKAFEKVMSLDPTDSTAKKYLGEL